MDAVELGYPVDVPKLMGSEGFGRDGITVNEVEATAHQSNGRVSILVNASIERSLLKPKDVSTPVNGVELASRDKVLETEPRRNDVQPIDSHVEGSCELHFRDTNCPSSTSMPEAVQAPKRAGRASRSSSGSLKRPRLAQLEDNMISAVLDEVKDISDNIGTYPSTKCNSLVEKTQTVKQRNNYSGRRGDKRNIKYSLKTKHDPFYTRTGLASFGSNAGGTNFFGVYGLKSEIHDVTKQIDDLSLKDLLDGTYQCPSLGRDKVKKVANTNENFLESVRKACSILPLAKPLPSENLGEMESCLNQKLLMCSPTSASLSNGDMRNSCREDQSSCAKESCSKSRTQVDVLDFPQYQPNHIWEKLALPPPRDLDSLLLDAAKPSASSRTSSDIRSGKQIIRRASLPPFPWSHNFNGHYRTNSDAVKVLTNRSMCHGRWVRVESSTSFIGNLTNSFTNLESLTYDQSLVPVSMSVRLPLCELGFPSLATCSKASRISLESGVELKEQVNVGHCPSVLAAAQTLCDLATRSWRQNPEGNIRLLKKPPQRISKARKTKFLEKPEEIIPAQVLQLASDNPARRSVDRIPSSKKPKLTANDKRKDICNTNGVRKGPINWSTPKSNRSSPNKSVKNSISGTRHFSCEDRQKCMLPPPLPPRVQDKSSNSQNKLRKTMPMDRDKVRDDRKD